MVLPKILLHDHLDGGLRPRTVADLAIEIGYGALPASNGDIEQFFDEQAAGSLADYLAPFRHTVAVMQTPAALRRVAMESVVDHASNGVVYAELRLAPSLHTGRGLTRDQVIESTLAGLALGGESSGTTARLIVSAMRERDDAREVVEAAAKYVDRGVVGFDLAGIEAGHPASRHAAALDAASQSGLKITIHAGEGEGVASIEDALDCGAERIGHGVRLIEDIDDTGVGLRLGSTADRVRSEGIALELCPKSEVDTQAVSSVAEHPIDAFHRNGFVTTVNTDNTLMSATDMSREFAMLTSEKGFSSGDLRTITLQAVDAAFCDASTKEEVRTRVAAGYDKLATE